jgi:predicted RNA-binding protein with RPS1 domain
LYNQSALLQAPVVDFNKGGLIVDVKGVRGFVPVSQVLDLRNISRQDGESEEVAQTLQAMNGRRLPLKIIEINRSRNRLILSERAAVQEQRTLRKDELIDQLDAGQVRRGVVSNLTSFGAFIDLGARTASCMSRSCRTIASIIPARCCGWGRKSMCPFSASIAKAKDRAEPQESPARPLEHGRRAVSRR